MRARLFISTCLVTSQLLISACSRVDDQATRGQLSKLTIPPGGKPKQIMLEGSKTVVVVVTVKQDSSSKRTFLDKVMTPHGTHPGEGRLILCGPDADLSGKNFVSEELVLHRAPHIDSLQQGLVESGNKSDDAVDVRLEFDEQGLFNQLSKAGTATFEVTFVGWYERDVDGTPQPFPSVEQMKGVTVKK